MHYGLITIEALDTIKGKPYAIISQEVRCEPDELFAEDKHLFGFGENNVSKRRVHYAIPLDATTEYITALLQSYPEAHIIAKIDHEPIRTTKQQEMLDAGVMSMVDLADAQLVRSSDRSAYIDSMGRSVFRREQLVLTGGRDQDYRQFALTGAEVETHDHPSSEKGETDEQETDIKQEAHQEGGADAKAT